MPEDLGWQCVSCGCVMPFLEGTQARTCRCTVYPQLDGVPTVKHAARDELDEALAAMRTAGRDGALKVLQRVAGADGIALDALAGVFAPIQSGARGFLADWTQATTEGRAHYFVLRWACPSFLSAMALSPLLAGRRVLDLGAGVGHLAAFLKTIAASTEIVIADGDLLHLLVARAYFVPGAPALCIDLDEPLPLPDRAFDAVVLSDCFHYVDRQRALLREVFRVLRPRGDVVLIHVHDPSNTRGERVVGTPIAPAACAKLVGDTGGGQCVSVRAVGEDALVDALVAGDGPAPVNGDAVGDLPPGAYSLWARRGAAAAVAPPSWGRLLSVDDLVPNPLYRVDPGDDGWGLTASWPNRETYDEFGRRPVLPASVELPRQVPRRRLHDLVRRGVLISSLCGRLAPPLGLALDTARNA